jgi:hypothetical protein
MQEAEGMNEEEFVRLFFNFRSNCYLATYRFFTNNLDVLTDLLYLLLRMVI